MVKSLEILEAIQGGRLKEKAFGRISRILDAPGFSATLITKCDADVIVHHNACNMYSFVNRPGSSEGLNLRY
jgi:hypothetical protein